MAGFMASNIVRSSGQGLLLDLVLGVIGAVRIPLHSHRRDRAHRLQSLQYVRSHHWRGRRALALPAV